MRKITKIMDGWSFIDQNGKKEPVTLPHTWNGKDGQDGGNDYYRGTLQYTAQFAKPVFTDRERIYLQFHGINASSNVILNDVSICRHEGGYSTFRVDVTERLITNNNIVIEVDNSVNDKVYPQKADFTFYGGIYRDIEIMVVSKEHFDLDYFGSPGIKYETRMSGKSADIHVTAYINEAARHKDVKTVITLVDEQGNIVAEAEGTDVNLHVPNAHLWDGLVDPYLYQMKAVLLKNGKMVDEVSCNCGIRTFEFSSKDGFHLNGRSYPLHGVSRHQDWKHMGNALFEEQMDQDMELIREIGANTIRLAHYQHNQYFYNLCDKFGMIVWAEIPYISDHMPNGRENTISQMKELIVQNYNHPCIVTWGISNEITISGGKYKKDMLQNHSALQKLCKKMDPTRVTTLACYAMCSPFNPVSKITDLVGWNLYLGWYVPGLFLNDLWISFYHLIYPNRCLCFSEYGAEGMPNLHSGKPKRGDHTEEYQAKYHDFMLKCFERHPYMWAGYVWNMFDFAADARNQGGEAGMNHKGLVTFDRKIKKDSFYLYKAWWNQKDFFVHIAGKRYEYRTGNMTEIIVYSNWQEVTLYNNGKYVGTQSGEHVFKFKLQMEDTNMLEVRAGAYMDQTVIYKTAQTRPEYKVKKGKSQNWI